MDEEKSTCPTPDVLARVRLPYLLWLDVRLVASVLVTDALGAVLGESSRLTRAAQARTNACYLDLAAEVHRCTGG